MNPEEDVIIEVKLPLKDYRMLREILEERQAMNGLKKWISGKILWVAAGVITLVGAFEALRRLGEYTR